MGVSYLLPCSCGRRTPVEPRQAGQVVRCTCGAALQVPTMLEMVALERAEPEPVRRRSSAPWGVRQSLALVGAAALAAALGLGVFLLWTQPAEPGPPRMEIRSEEIRREIRALTPVQSWHIWQSLRVRGVDGRMPRQERAYTKAIEQYCERLLRWWLSMGVVLIVAIAAFALIVTPLLTKTHRSAARNA